MLHIKTDFYVLFLQRGLIFASVFEGLLASSSYMFLKEGKKEEKMFKNASSSSKLQLQRSAVVWVKCGSKTSDD